MFGLSGGASGTGFDKPAMAQVTGGVDPGQISRSYGDVQKNLQQQQNLLQALGNQNSLQAQSGVFNQLQGVANGTGPNPAQAMLNQQTGNNIANQAALMAGQRGAGANVGLMARQAGQQGGAIQQQAVGQGATMQANQSLNALNQMGGMANTMAGNYLNQANANTSAQQAEQGNLLNALAGLNSANVSSQGSVNAANAGLASKGMEGQQSLIGGAMHTAAAALSSGGMIGRYADGGSVGPQSSFGSFVTTVNSPQATSVQQPQFSSSNAGAEELKSGVGDLGSSLKNKPGTSSFTPYAPGANAPGPFAPKAAGGMVDVVLSPGEKVVPPNKVNEAAGGKIEAKKVPGEAKVAGDSLKNDTYRTKLPEGSIVVPRTKSKDNKDSAAFVRATLAKRGRGK